MVDNLIENDDKYTPYTYTDPELEKALKGLASRSLEELVTLQLNIALKLSQASEDFNVKRTEINAAKRTYYFKILIIVCIEVWRFIRGEPALALKSKLNKDKQDLKTQFEKESQILNEQMTIIQASLKKIKLHSEDAAEKEKELEAIQTIIKNLDEKISALDNHDPNDMQAIKDQLDIHVEERDMVSAYITDTYQKIETILNSLGSMFHNAFPITELAQQKTTLQNNIGLLKDKCKNIDYPVISDLLSFLKYQTDSSLQVLKKSIAKSNSFESDRQISDLIWEAGLLFPAITAGQNREEIIAKRLESKETELEKIKAVMESADNSLHKKENPVVRKQLDDVAKKHDEVSMEIANLLMSYQDILTGKHPDLLEKVHAFAGARIQHSKVKELKSECDKIKHPISVKLKYFLMYRTEVSLQALKETLKNDHSYQESKALTNLIWEVSKIEPQITEGLTKEIELPSIKEIQQPIFNEISEKLQVLEQNLEEIQIEKNKLQRTLSHLEVEMEKVDAQIKAITGCGPTSYIPRATLKALSPEDFNAYDEARSLKKDLTSQLNQNIRREKELNAMIESFENEKKSCILKPVLFTPEILQVLITKCSSGTLFSRPHPVMIALSQFLNYHTPTLLNKLQKTMQAHPDYTNNPKAKAYLEEANLYFPYIFNSNDLEHGHSMGFFKAAITPKEAENVAKSTPRPGHQSSE